MVRTKRRQAENLTALLLGVGSVIACVSGATPDDGGDKDASCTPECDPGFVCQEGACVPSTSTGGSSGTGAGGQPTGGVGASGGVATGGVSGTNSGGTGNVGGMGGVLPTGGDGGANGGAFPQGGSTVGGTGGTGNTGAIGGQGGTGTGGTPTGGTGGKAMGGTGGSAGKATGGTGGKATGGTGGSSAGSTGVCNPTGTTSCNVGGAMNGNGSFTYYYFGQGTARDGNGYRTACGYYGTENGMTDTVQNISNTSPANNTYFVAIPATSPSNFDTSQYCGACVELTGQNGRKIVATVIDMCPKDSNPACQAAGHLDVSKAAFDQLGFSVGNPSNTTWRFVPCPVGSMKVNTRMKSGNNNEFFIEGGITAIASVSVNGTMATRTSYGAWHINMAVPNGAMLTLTDKGGSGRTAITVPLNPSSTSNQDSGCQFQGCN
jgi:hypothetical protein